MKRLPFPVQSRGDLEDHRKSRRGDSGGERRPASYYLYQFVATQGSREFGTAGDNAWAPARPGSAPQGCAPSCSSKGPRRLLRSHVSGRRMRRLYMSRLDVARSCRSTVYPSSDCKFVVQPSSDRRHTSPKAKSLCYQCDPAMPPRLRSRHLLTSADVS